MKSRIALAVMVQFAVISCVSNPYKDISSQDPRIRQKAAIHLGEMNDPRGIKLLVATLRDEKRFVQKSAEKSLVNIGQAAVMPLVASLADKDVEYRFRVATILHKLSWKPKTIQEKVSFFIAMRQWKKIVKMGKSVYPYLVAALRDNNKSIRRNSAKLLEEMGWRPANVTEQVNFYLTYRSKKDLVMIGSSAVNPLLDALTIQDEALSQYIVEVLGEIGDVRAHKTLVVILRDANKDMRIRSKAASSLEKMQWKPTTQQDRIFYSIALHRWADLVKIGTAAVESLIALIGKEYYLQAGAIKSLGQIGDLRAVEPIITALSSGEKSARAQAAESLGELKDMRAVPALILALSDQDRIVRSRAAAALGKIKDNRALDPLISSLKDEHWSVKSEAAMALASLNDSQAIKPLMLALRDHEIRDHALQALNKLDWNPTNIEDRVITLLAKSKIDKIARIGPAAVPTLISALRDGSWPVRQTAANALGRIKDQRAVEPLILVLDDKHSNVRAAAASALGQLGDRRGVKPLIKTLTVPRTNLSAVESLDKLGWIPETDEERIHFQVAKRNGKYLKKHWRITKMVLLGDIKPQGGPAVRNALLAFIGIGYKEIIPDLIEKLNAIGDREMAEEFLNCGHKQLEAAGRQWADRNGYTIQPYSGSPTVIWGEMR